MKTDAELETLLRATLRSRAGDVTDAPPLPAAQHSHPTRRWLPILAAAAVVVGVAVGVTVAATNHGGHHKPANHLPTPAPRSHAPRHAVLDWFGMRPLPGYKLLSQVTSADYRQLAVRANKDTGVPVGCNGCEMASSYVTVFGRGKFDGYAAAGHVRSWPRVDIAGARGYLGTMQLLGTKHTVPTVAWQYGPDEWVMVQGVTDFGGARRNLLTVARAAQPNVAIPITLPFRLGYVPNLPVTSVEDARPSGYALNLTFGSITVDQTGTAFEITVWPHWNGSVERSGRTRRVIGGRVGYCDPTSAVCDVAIHNGFVEFGIEGPGGAVHAAERRAMALVIAGLRWTHGDGSIPWLPAEQAIP